MGTEDGASTTQGCLCGLHKCEMAQVKLGITWDGRVGGAWDQM